MRQDILEFLESKKNLRQFIRENPIWYRRLTRNPTDKHSIELAAKDFYKQTIPHKVEKFSNSLEFASMMMQMYRTMGSGD
jgi:hypothetical protein